ncbi:MAG: KAP family P-loop NTPase fold protein [Promethearchaeota archaeon]
MFELNLETNEPLSELTQDKDLFGTYEKMDFIESFLENEAKSNNIKKNNMIALYGLWGSGKSTIINTLNQKLNKELYKSIIFYAWKYERDQNLAFSLYERLVDELESEEQKKNYLKTAWNLLKGGLKGIEIPLGVVSFNPSKTIKGIEDAIAGKSIKNSLYSRIKEFEEQFSKLIREILGEKEKLLIIFIDDLDRCEPDHILDLLSMIKLFFTFGSESYLKKESKIIFFCGIDKDAINKAIRKRYGDIIKSEEYLEKIFDISFNMPLDNYEVNKYLNNLNLFEKEKEVPKISNFLKEIKFTNPRHTKKILNKYRLLCYLKKENKSKYSQLIPNIIIGDGKGYIFDTIMVLYFIILHEFYIYRFYEIKDYDGKMINFIHHFVGDKSSGKAVQNIINSIDNRIRIINMGNELLFKHIDNGSLMKRNKDITRVFKFVNFFTPRISNNFNCNNMNDISYFDQFKNSDNKILIYFCKYLFNYIEQITTNQAGERELMKNYNLLDLFDMAEILL